MADLNEVITVPTVALRAEPGRVRDGEIAPPEGSRVPGVWTAIFWGLVILSLAGVWSGTYFVTQDGPAHVQGSSLLLKAITGEPGLWREYYYLNPRPVPNWLGHLVLAALMAIFSPNVA